MGDMSRLRPLGLVILAVLIYYVGVGELVARLRSADIGVFLTGFAILVLSALAFLVRWQVLLRGIGYNIPWRSATEIALLGLFSNLFTPGRLGDIPVRAFFLKRREGVPVKDGLATTSGDRYVDIMFLMVVGLVSFWLLTGTVEIAALQGAGMAQVRSAVAVVLLLMAAVPAVALTRTAFFIGLLRRVLPEPAGPHLDTAEEAVPRLVDNLRTFLHGPSLAALIVCTPAMWILYALSFHVYLLSFGETADPWLVLPAFFVAYLFGLMSMVPGGIGTSDLGVVAILASAGIDRSAALIASIAVKVTNLIYVGCLCLLIPDRAAIEEAAGVIGEENAGANPVPQGDGSSGPRSREE